ncbi:sugar phosphate isomerase/epimerase family protein [Piscinibacter sakaiensis]|uniref:sugar phosphate isomerase/epimerase family protein n=1 Tax=Piscinibacter sakaiensis TaxID=1547922 RepID=UPI003AAEB329
MQLAVSSASTPSLTPAELIAAAASSGYAGIEWRVSDDVDRLDEASGWNFRSNNRCTVAQNAGALQEIAARCADAGLSIVGLSPYLTVGDIAAAEDLIGIAADIGVSRIRVWAPSTREPGPYRPAIERMRRWLSDLEPVLLRHRVRFALEVHQATVCPSAAMALRMLDGIDTAAVGVLYDIGNLAVEGFEHPPLALELIGDRLTHVQIKNAVWLSPGAGRPWQWHWCPMDEGQLDLPGIVAALVDAGFAGWISAEDFSTRQTDLDKLTRNHMLLQRWISDAHSRHTR